MDGDAFRTEKVSVMLAGAGYEAVYYQMQPPFLADARFLVSGHATQWPLFLTNLENLQPQLLVVLGDIAPGPDELMSALARLSAWRGVALVVLNEAQRDFQGAFARVEVVRGVFLAPVSWQEIAQAAYGAAVTARAQLSQAAPLQVESDPQQRRAHSALITGTRRVAVLSHAGGAGVSTVAESLAYALAVQRSVKTLLVSMGLPPAAVPHLGLRYTPSLSEYFDRPGRASFQAAVQMRESLEVLLAPEPSVEYLRILERSAAGTGEGSIHAMLGDSEDGRYAAVVMDVPQAEDAWMTHALVFANHALLVFRPTLADLAAARHTLGLLLSGLKSEKRLARESIHLVLNQAGERSGFTPRAFQEELARSTGWAPPIAAVIPFDPAVQRAQDDSQPPLLRASAFADGIHSAASVLFPALEGQSASREGRKSFLRLPRIRFN